MIRLTPPDARICPACHGMGWYYVETPGRNRPLGAELRQCRRLHAEGVLHRSDGAQTLVYAEPAAPVV